MTEDTVGFLRRENSDLRLEVEHLREKAERTSQELTVLREHGSRLRLHEKISRTLGIHKGDLN